ncbi:hypothetical protein QTP88_001403 [Uroleucon formosanum]
MFPHKTTVEDKSGQSGFLGVQNECYKRKSKDLLTISQQSFRRRIVQEIVGSDDDEPVNSNGNTIEKDNLNDGSDNNCNQSINCPKSDDLINFDNNDIWIRQFLLYTAHVILYKILNPQVYSYLISLHVAMRILSNETFLENYADYAQSLLEHFVDTFIILYAKKIRQAPSTNPQEIQRKSVIKFTNTEDKKLYPQGFFKKSLEWTNFKTTDVNK